MSMNHGFIVVDPRKPKRKRFRAMVFDRDLSEEFGMWIRVREDKYFPTRLAAQMWIDVELYSHGSLN